MLFASGELFGAAAGGGGNLAGELLGPAWLGLAALDWFSRGIRVGGVYGRPLTMANLLLFAPSSLSLLRAARAGGSPAGSGPLSGDLREALLWVLAGSFGAFAVLFGRRLFRPPRVTAGA